MYYAFFGLSHAPFRITPDTEVFFKGGKRGAILEALIYAISQGEGIVKVTGEVGSGKTMLCRMLQTHLPANVETVYLANPSVPPEEILLAIAFELQMPISKDAGRLEVMHRLNEYLLERHAQHKQVVLFVEESQGIPIATLEEIRLLSNLETNDHKLLQIVLFGQPELDENLRKPQIRQLRERITHSFRLAPLAANDIHSYLSFRLHAAGYRGPDLFSKRVAEQIARVSAGLTRRVNIVADKAMLAAFAQGSHNISLAHVRAAARDSEFSDTPLVRSHSAMAYGVAGVLVGALFGAGAFSAYQLARDPVETPPAGIAAGPPAATPAPASLVPQSSTAAVTPPSSPPVMQTSPPSAGPATRRVAPSPQVDQPAGNPSEDLLEQRLQATDRWLLEGPESIYSLQLMGSSDTELLRNYFNTISKYLELDKVFVYRTVAKQRPSMTVLYGSFASCAEAAARVEKLPDLFKANRPYCRTIKGIRAEIALHRS
jgi:MSHA biogenesis protein MshM